MFNLSHLLGLVFFVLCSLFGKFSCNTVILVYSDTSLFLGDGDRNHHIHADVVLTVLSIRHLDHMHICMLPDVGFANLIRQTVVFLSQRLNKMLEECLKCIK